MSRQYLDVPYRSKDAAKALGARFDGTVKRWYVEAGTDLFAFSAWLPAELRAVALPAFGGLEDPGRHGDAGAVSLDVKKGILLSRLLNDVSAAVAQAFAAGVWTLVEVVEARTRNGHVYLELSERDSQGQPVAKARALIWASTAARVLPQFEEATGAVIGPGIKLLVRARPVFKAQYGFSLELDAIDPDYTLGDLEARKKEIRARLQREGVFERNRQLPAPWDYRHVLVVAPAEAAGLGDFQKEADRLVRFGLCDFVYAHSRFQGEGAALEIIAAATAALRTATGDQRPDAIAIIRGGGAVNDLAWLNDYALARFICDLEIPVITGIGHERDSTIPDEVAHTRYDTPSKVIAGIEQQILRRAREARAAWDAVSASSVRWTQKVRSDADRWDAQIRSDARTHLARARQDSTGDFHAIATGAMQAVHAASRESVALLNQVKVETMQQIAGARQSVPILMADVRAGALAHTGRARSVAQAAYNATVESVAIGSRQAHRDVALELQRVAERAQSAVQQARTLSQAMVREVTGQGPEQTLARGFAIVRSSGGPPITSRHQMPDSGHLQLQFRDGTAEVSAVPLNKKIEE